MSQDQSYDQALSNESSHQHVQKRINPFSIDFFIEKRFIIQKDIKTILEDVRYLYNIHSISLTPQNQIPSLEGTAFLIVEYDVNKLYSQCDAIYKILQLIEQRNQQTLKVILLIPEGSVPYVIGTQGKYIEHIKLETKVYLVVNQPIYQFQLKNSQNYW